MKRLIFTVMILATVFPAAFAVESAVLIRNSTGYEAKEIYIAPISWSEWGTDYLSGMTLADGAEVLFNLFPSSIGECLFDIRMVDADGDEYIKYEIDVCADNLVELTFDDYVDPKQTDEGYDAGYEAGYEAGFKEGYDRGYEDGIREGSEKAR